MNCIYKLLGFKRFPIIEIDDEFAWIEHKDKVNFVIPIDLINNEKEVWLK